MITYYLTNCSRQDLISPLSSTDVYIINRHQEVFCTKLQSVVNVKLSKCFWIMVKMWIKETRFKFIPFVEIKMETFVLVVLCCMAFCCFELYRVALHCSVLAVMCFIIHSFFFYKNIFYKNIEADIHEILRIFQE